MERLPINPGGRSRVHFNASNRDEEAEPTVNVTSFDPDPDEGTDEGKSVTDSQISEEDGKTKDITEVKSPSSFYFEEIEDEDNEGGGEFEGRRASHENEQIHRFLRFTSPSAPASPQSSPPSSPRSFPASRSSDIPLLDLNLNRTPPQQQQLDSRPSNAGTIVEGQQLEKRNSLDSPEDVGKKEAQQLIREHSKRHRSKDYFRHMSSGEVFRSGTSTPEDHDSKHYTFNSGVLSNLLKLYKTHPQPQFV